MAATYVAALHAATAQRVTFDTAIMAALVETPLERLTRACASAATEGALRRVHDTCVRGLAGRELPLVRTHGDFTESNCLFSSEGRLAAVVDWELSTGRGLPLLDLLQLMPVPGESGSHPRWQRFDVWRRLLDDPADLLGDAVIGGYVDRMQIPVESLAALLLMQWVTHVAERVDARRDDARWMQQRVWQPLETLEGFRD